jgi:hypothetical protein
MAPRAFPANDKDAQPGWFQDERNRDFGEWVAEEKWDLLAEFIVIVIGREFFNNKYPIKKKETLFDKDPIFNTGITTLHRVIRDALQQSKPSTAVTITYKSTGGTALDWQPLKTNSMSWSTVRKNMRKTGAVGGNQAITLDEMVSVVLRDVKIRFGMEPRAAGYQVWLEAAFVAYLPHVIVEEKLRDPSTSWGTDVAYALQVLHLLARHDLCNALGMEIRRLERQIGELEYASDKDLRDLHYLGRARGLYMILGPDSNAQFYLTSAPAAHVVKYGANLMGGNDVQVP